MALPQITFEVPSGNSLAVLLSHRLRFVWRPALSTVACTVIRATVRRLEKLYVHEIRRFVAAAPTCRFQRPAMCRTHTHVLQLVQDTMIAVRHAAATVAKHTAVTTPLSRLQECRAQRLRRDSKSVTQANDINYAQFRHDALVGIDVRPHQSRNDVPWQCIRLLEFPQDRDERLARIEPFSVEEVPERGGQLAFVEREDRKARRTQQPAAKQRRQERGRLHGVTAHSRSGARHGSIRQAPDSIPGRP